MRDSDVTRGDFRRLPRWPLFAPPSHRARVPSDLPLSWATALDQTGTIDRDFFAQSEPGRIRVSGHLSVGTRGWALKAEAGRRRATITLRVTAVETQAERVPDLEFHRYEATIGVWRSGRYRLRIMHAYIPMGRPGEGLQDPVFEEILSVP